MNSSPATILAVIAIVFAAASIVKPDWHLTSISCLLLGIAVLLVTN